MEHYSHIVVGAGIVGLTIAWELRQRGHQKILVIEKESEPAQHSSGRNSGVLHAGIYYPSDSLKAKFCLDGLVKLKAFAQENKIPVNACGKVIVAQSPDHVEDLEKLYQRAQNNGVQIERLDHQQLAEIEPFAKTSKFALYSPNTATIDPHLLVRSLIDRLLDRGVQFVFGAPVWKIEESNRRLQMGAQWIGYDTVVNAAGLHADRLAHLCGINKKYRILPFKGIYQRLSGRWIDRVNSLIYPTPDPNLPFLGVHITKKYDGQVYTGPTALPAFGRENYQGLQGLSWVDLMRMSKQVLSMMASNQQNMRHQIWSEIKKLSRTGLTRECQRMVRDFLPQDITSYQKVGIRAQMVDTKKNQLIMDFMTKKSATGIHILNAVSPGLTSSFAFADHIVSELQKDGRG